MAPVVYTRIHQCRRFSAALALVCLLQLQLLPHWGALAWTSPPNGSFRRTVTVTGNRGYSSVRQSRGTPCQRSTHAYPRSRDIARIGLPLPVGLLQASDKDKSDDQEESAEHKNNVGKRLALSRNRAISALSQQPTKKTKHSPSQLQSPSQSQSQSQSLPKSKSPPKSKSKSRSISGSGSGSNQILPPAVPKRNSNRSRRNRRTRMSRKGDSGMRSKAMDSYKEDRSRPSTATDRPVEKLPETRVQKRPAPPPPPPPPRRKPPSPAVPAKKAAYSSLLPPPLTGGAGNSGSDDNDDDDDDPLSSGLSSWEEFLGASSAAAAATAPAPTATASSSPLSTPPLASSERRQERKTNPTSRPNGSNEQRLPSIQELFPPDLSASSTGAGASTGSAQNQQTQSQQASGSSKGRRTQPLLDGVLPVSDLFYRSSVQQENDSRDDSDDDDDDEHDDEELPFSAEQSDSVSSENNKVHIRRNTVGQSQSQSQSQQQPKATEASKPRKNNSRKMVRRGMEMLVGGVPINADPPLRAVELYYDETAVDWGSTISLSTRDFGPLLHTASTAHVSQTEKGLFCEHFCHAAMKWDVCPKDLRQIVKSYSLQQFQSRGSAAVGKNSNRPVRLDDTETSSNVTSTSNSSSPSEETGGDKDSSGDAPAPEAIKLSDNVELKEEETVTDSSEGAPIDSNNRRTRSKAKGFGKDKDLKQPKAKREQHVDPGVGVSKRVQFKIGVSKAELESGQGGADGDILKAMLIRAHTLVLKKELEGFRIGFLSLELTDMDDGATLVDSVYSIVATSPFTEQELSRRTKQINTALLQSLDDDELLVAMAAATKEDTSWPEEVRARVMEELLFGDDEDDGATGPTVDMVPSDYNAQDSCDVDLSGSSASPLHMRDDIFLGGGLDGVFYDYSESNALNSPYGGEIGLRLVDAVTERAKQRSRRVIAIGDVHGCIDELQDLLRECDYQPGDLVVFLGDLVCKGPDSISVVQMAREIGAVGVRGNHDFEVIRWHQAIKSGVDPPVVGSEHFHIASCLSEADMKWMYSLPWYLSSKELGALFVHAGFVSGIRLAKQNPRLMMNMRSILPDGTVTSKFFNNWPWARLWDGPQTVLFGHDADRGLQQYEHAIGLDTGCVYGGRLTACILPEKRLVSVSARREYFKYRRKHYD